MTAQMQHERPFLRDADAQSDLPEARSFVGLTGEIRHLIAEILGYLMTVLPDRPVLHGDAELVIAEALNNIEEHGYEAMPGMPVQVKLSVLGDAVQVETKDFGIPMPGLTVPPIHRPDARVSREQLPEGGFGWYLIHSLAPEPVYRRCGNMNRLIFRLRINTKAH